MVYSMVYSMVYCCSDLAILAKLNNICAPSTKLVLIGISYIFTFFLDLQWIDINSYEADES